MPSQAAIARDWGTSREYVRQKVKEGCPTDSLELAREWRLAHTTSRQTTSPAQLARIVSEEKDDDSPGARERRKKYLEGKPDGAELPKPESTLQDALSNSIRAADEAWRLLEEAMIEEKDQKISVRLSVHNKAVDQRFKAEAAYREEMERRRVLIPLTEAKDWARRVFEIIVSRLSALPQNIAPRCNPHDPHHAMDILQHECVTIIADAQKAISV